MRVFRATGSAARIAVSAVTWFIWQGDGLAHTVSIGYEHAGPGAVNIWYGSYHDDANFNEGSLHLQGPSLSTTVAFSMLTTSKPGGLVDGATNFYSNGTSLVGVPVPLTTNGGSYDGLASSVINWQGAHFTGLAPGTYTFTYVPIANPTFEWDPIDDVILTSTFTLTAYDVLGIDGFGSFGTNTNQRSVGDAMDRAINGGAFNQDFYNLALLSPPALAEALTQLSGETLTQVGPAGFQSMNAFLMAMLDPWSGGPGGRAGDFAADFGSMPGAGFGGTPYGTGLYGSPQYAMPGAGGAPAGGAPYSTAPYGNPAYANPPYGNNPDGNSQYGGGQPGASPGYGNSPYGNSPYGNSAYGDPQNPYGAGRYAAGNRARRAAGDGRCRGTVDVGAYDPCWGLWVTPYGGYSFTSGNDAIGSHDTSLRSSGMITGLDYRFGRGAIAGFALSAGTSSWGLSDALGGGRSDVLQAGVYGSKRFDSFYLSAAAAYSWQRVSTNRVMTLAGDDHLGADFDAHGFSGRAEIGNRFDIRSYGVTPYGAFQTMQVSTPAYDEAASSGANTFALSVEAREATQSRTELGFWFDRRFFFETGLFTLRSRLAWEHNWGNGSVTFATFQNLANGSFAVIGTAPSPNAALVSLVAEMRRDNGWSVGAKFDGEIGSTSQSFVGTALVRREW